MRPTVRLRVSRPDRDGIWPSYSGQVVRDDGDETLCQGCQPPAQHHGRHQLPRLTGTCCDARSSQGRAGGQAGGAGGEGRRTEAGLNCPARRAARYSAAVMPLLLRPLPSPPPPPEASLPEVAAA